MNFWKPYENLPFNKLIKFYTYERNIKESPYNGEDNVPTRDLMIPR